MEIGQHCSLETCVRLDFLPFLCQTCSNFYCLEHRFDHECASPSSTAVCVVCQQLLTVETKQQLDQHLHSGCQLFVGKKQEKGTCGFGGCKVPKMFLTICKFCSTSTCLHHRHAHACPQQKLHIKPKVLVPKPIQLKKTSPQVNLMRLKLKAKGPSIDMPLRVYFTIHYKEKTLERYLGGTTTVGKATDLMSALFNLPPHHRYGLMANHVLLTASMTLYECIEKNLFLNGGDLNLIQLDI